MSWQAETQGWIRWKYLLLIVVLPLVAIYGPRLVFRQMPEWPARLLAMTALAAGVPIGAAIVGLNSNVELIKPGAKLNRVGFESRKRSSVWVIRVLAVAFSIFFVWQVTWPFARDLVELAGRGGPQTVDGLVARNGAFLILRQSINLVRDGKTELNSYALFFSFTVPRAGKAYRFQVMPRSRVVLAVLGESK